MTAKTDTTKAAVLKLLSSGECTVAEAARLAGESRQLMAQWATRAGLDPVSIRNARLARLWKETMK